MTSRANWSPWAVAAVLVIGAFFRLHNLGAMEFKGDESEALDRGIQLLRDHPWSSAEPWPAHGMATSARIANAPLFTWIVALVWAVTPDPVSVARLIALANTVSLYPFWRWARRRMDERRAFLALGLLAVGPFAVIFSRKIWAQDLLLPGLLAVLWGVEYLRGQRPWRGLTLIGLGALAVGQLHLSGAIAIALLPVAIVVQLWADRHRGRSGPRRSRPSVPEVVALTAVIGANAFLWLPYLGYIASIPPETFGDRPQLSSFTPGLLFNVATQVVPQDLFYFFAPDRGDFEQNPLRWVVYQSSLMLGAPLFLYGLWRWLRAPLSVPVLGVWWWLVIAAFTVARIPSYPFYVLVLAPLPILLATGAFDGSLPRAWMGRALHAWRWAYLLSLLGLTLATGAWVIGRGGSGGDYGVSYAIREAQARSIVDRLRIQPPRHFDELGEARPDVAAALECHPNRREMNWLVRWIAQTTGSVGNFAVCDGWVDLDGRNVYQWTIGTVE